MKRLAIFAAGLLLSSGALLAGEKAVMHCFAFTVVDSATPAEWAAFSKETDALPHKIKGIKRVWHGKLVNPLSVYQVNIEDAEARKKFQAEGQGTANVKRLRRQHGVCMEFNDLAAFKAYNDDPAHKSWVSTYEKVRVAGTTTYQIQGE